MPRARPPRGLGTVSTIDEALDFLSTLSYDLAALADTSSDEAVQIASPGIVTDHVAPDSR